MTLNCSLDFALVMPHMKMVYLERNQAHDFKEIPPSAMELFDVFDIL